MELLTFFEGEIDGKSRAIPAKVKAATGRRLNVNRDPKNLQIHRATSDFYRHFNASMFSTARPHFTPDFGLPGQFYIKEKESERARDRKYVIPRADLLFFNLVRG